MSGAAGLSMTVLGNWEKRPPIRARITGDDPSWFGPRQGPQIYPAGREHAIVLTSYSLLHRDLEHFQKVRWSGIILDEAQNIKIRTRGQARAARDLRPIIASL